MTLADRAAAYAQAYAKWPASHARVVVEQRRQVLYATWGIGNDYRNKTGFYGSYPPGYLARVMALFPDVGRNVLHAFSGSLPAGEYVRLDLNPAVLPDVVGSVYDASRLFDAPYWSKFALVVADPPYSAKDAERYGTPTVNRRLATAALACVTAPGGYLAWLDCVWPMHSKRDWLTVGRITVVRSTNHRVRLLTLFERTADEGGG